MLSLQSHFRPREEEVASKVIDGEAIIINLANGVYYSMDKVGALVWDLLQAGHTLEEVIVGVTGRYDVAREQAEANVRDLVQELVQENLVVSIENGAAVPAQPMEHQDRVPYEIPKLNIYRDMGDLLALDPPVPGLGDTPWKEPEEPSK
jgi:Coenzyme PQQ synthesis protein D (PqqD)